MPNIPMISIVAQLIPTYHPMGDNIILNISNPKTPPNPCIIVLKISLRGLGNIIIVRITTPTMIKKIKKLLLPTIIPPSI